MKVVLSVNVCSWPALAEILDEYRRVGERLESGYSGRSHSPWTWQDVCAPAAPPSSVATSTFSGLATIAGEGVSSARVRREVSGHASRADVNLQVAEYVSWCVSRLAARADRRSFARVERCVRGVTRIDGGGDPPQVAPQRLSASLPGAGPAALGVGHGGIQGHDLRGHPHAEREGELAHGSRGEVALAGEHARDPGPRACRPAPQRAASCACVRPCFSRRSMTCSAMS